MPVRNPQAIFDQITAAGGRVDPPEVVAANTLRMVLGGTDRVWDQHNWVATRGGVGGCQTACCVAGDAVLQTGVICAVTDTNRNGGVVIDGRLYDIPDVAQALLGLNNREAVWLFDGYRSWEWVVAALEAIRDGKSVSELLGWGSDDAI